MRHLPLLLLSLLLLRCGPGQPDTTTATRNIQASQPKPDFRIVDSTAITSYEQGLRIYLVRSGPGTRPVDGSMLKLHYQCRLPNGTVIDDTWARKEPFELTLGQTELIAGMEAALRKIRMGSRAVVMVPAALAYTGEERPAGIPKDSPLIYELEMLGYI
jgi:FKBP-type peptidyl-prolyl cis-trans isomerase